MAEYPYQFGQQPLLGGPFNLSQQQLPVAPGNGLAQGGGAAPGQGQSSLFNAPHPLAEGELGRALFRAARDAGVNLAGFSPHADKILKSSKKLLAELILQNGGNLEAMLEDPNAAIGALSNLIRRGVSGEKIFGGGDKTGALDALSALAGRYNPESGEKQVGATYAAALLSEPERAMGLLNEAKYGGLHDSFFGAATRPAASQIERLQQQMESGAIRPNPQTGSVDFLALLRGLVQAAQAENQTPLGGAQASLGMTPAAGSPYGGLLGR